MPKPTKRWDAETVVSAIRKLQQEGQALNLASVRRGNVVLVNAAVTYCGSWRNAIEAAGINYDSVKQKPVSKGKRRVWSEDLVIDQIKWRVTQEKSIKGSVVYEEDSGLYNAARKFFGKNGWSKARVAAGFQPHDPRPNLKWTRETVREEILRLYNEDVTLNSSYIHKSSEYAHLQWAAQNVYGSWRVAIEASGLDYEEIQIKAESKWTRDVIITEIENLEQSGWRLSSRTTQKLHGAIFAAALKEFGTWGRAVEAAGINYRKHLRQWSLKTFLRQLSQEDYERTINSRVVRETRTSNK